MTVLLAVLSACVLSGCVKGGAARSAPALTDTWIQVEPGKDLCAPGFPGVPWRRNAHAAATREAVAALSQGDLATADALLGEVPMEHPAAVAARAVLQLMGSEAEMPARDLVGLVEVHPQEPCLATTAALAMWAAQRGNNAVNLIEHARALAPSDGRVAFLSWFLQLESADDVRDAIDAGLTAEPDHPGMRLVRAVGAVESGDWEAATADLTVASAAGLSEADSVLLQVAFRAQDWDTYLRAASRMGLPLGDDGSIATADDAMAAYWSLLGGEGPHTARITTSLGELNCTLRPDLAPVTVANFVGLARGTLAWRDPRTGAERRAPLYDGTSFHRVIPEFMIQGGDPLGTGSGGPGYTFVDEVSEATRFDRPGLLAMANRGPHTNGSQFFVTEVPVSHLDGRYTVFGECDEASVQVVKRIARVPVDDHTPVDPVVVQSVEIAP